MVKVGLRERPQGKCPIWGVDCNVWQSETDPESIVVRGSSRVAYVRYEISKEACAEISDSLWDEAKAHLTTMLIDSWVRDQPRRIGTNEIRLAEEIQSLPVYQRADRLLKFLAGESTSIGNIAEFRSNYPQEFLDKALAWSESTTTEEVEYLANYLKQEGWISTGKQLQANLRDSYDKGLHLWRVEVPGYRRIEEIETNIDSSQCFVAMWFDVSMNDARNEGIIPAIVSAGYNPLIIDQEEFIGKIDDKIIAEIKRSRFIVADFTHRKADIRDGKCQETEEGHRRLGARGGVYYEAGFAEGLGLDVIPTCRSDMINEIHFDTRQLNHIVWDSPEDLRERLENRIRRVIGEGPNSVK